MTRKLSHPTATRSGSGWARAFRSLGRTGLASLAVVAGALLLGTPAAHADVTAKDVQLMLKVVGFLTPPVSGTVAVAIVFDAANGDSKKEAETLKGFLDAAQGGPIVPVARLYSQSDLGSLDARVVIVTVGLPPAELDAVAATAQARKMLTMSTDPTCAKGGKCVLSVRTSPKVEILFNSAVAQGAGIEFQPTFRMMMTGV